jgi:hypothetical protein
VEQVQAENRARAAAAAGGASTAPAARGGGAATAAAGNGAGKAYTFSLKRAAELGSFDTRVTIERTYATTLNAPGRPPAVKNYTLKAELAGKVWVNAVRDGELADFRISLEKFEINGKAAYKPGDSLRLERSGGRVAVVTLEGEECPPDDVLKALEIMFDGLGVNPAGEDEIFGTKGAHKVGAEWAVDAKRLAPEVERLAAVRLDVGKLKAKGKVVGVEAGKSGEAVRMTVGFEATQWTNDPPDAGYRLGSSVMRGTYGRVVRAEGGGVVEASFAYDMTINEAAASGEKYECKVHQAWTQVSSPVTPAASRPAR